MVRLAPNKRLARHMRGMQRAHKILWPIGNRGRPCVCCSGYFSGPRLRLPAPRKQLWCDFWGRCRDLCRATAFERSKLPVPCVHVHESGTWCVASAVAFTCTFEIVSCRRCVFSAEIKGDAGATPRLPL